MNYILFDDNTRNDLLPFTFTAPIAEIRCGILTMKEKWKKYLNKEISHLTEDYLSKKFALKILGENILINSSVFPNKDLLNAIYNLNDKEKLVQNDVLIAIKSTEQNITKDFIYNNDYKQIEYNTEIKKINNTWDIFSFNDFAIRDDFELITNGRTSQEISKTNNILGKENIFVEEGAKLEFATLNAETGPIYIGKDAEIMENAAIRGPFAICEHSAVKLSTKIYGPTTIGPHSKVGGELNNVVIFGYTNKAHDGFLGNSVIGRWCNLGADTNNSNLKNNYVNVRLWNYNTENFAKTKLQFCGLMLGDHSKSAINTMFNTGTVVGVFANIFGSGFPRNFVPSFSWGGAHGMTEYGIKKAFEVAEKVMARRNIEFDDIEKDILIKVFELTAKYRR